MVWLSSAPTWTEMLFWLPSSTLVPLNDVCFEIRLISAVRWLISSWIELRSDLELVPFWAWTVSERMRCRLSLTWLRAPSVVWASEMPSLAFEDAWFRPLIWLVMRLAMAWPAASSLAELILLPEDRRSIAVLSLSCD